MFRSPLLRNIVLLSIAAIILLGVYDFFYVHPSFTKLLAEHAEEDAVRIATHMQSMLTTGDAPLNEGAIPVNFIKHIEHMQREFGLMKVKVFSLSGEVIYSTDPEDIGYITKERYFHEIVLKGNTYAKVVQKGVKSLTSPRHVVEANVPITRGSKVLGVLEIYLDITDTKDRLNRLILFADISLFAIAFVLLSGVIMVSSRVGKILAERERMELELSQMQKTVKTTHIGITITDNEGKIIYTNPVDAAMHGYAVEELIGKDARIFSPPELRKPMMFEQMKAFRCWSRESVNIRKDGSIFPVWLISDVIFNDDGKAISVVTVCDNITERKKTQEQLIRHSDELKEINDELAMLYKMSSAISRTIDMNKLLPLVLDTVTGLEGFNIERKGGIFSVEGNRMRLIAHLGQSDEFLALHKDMKIGDCLCGLTAKTGEVIISTDSAKDSRHTIAYPDMNPHGHICIPLKAVDKIVGVLYLYLPVDFHIDERKVKMFQSIGNLIGIAIENARLYEETKLLSLHDPLTGLANRRLLDIIFERNFATAKRFGSPLLVIMMDIDHFKKYNDTYGHLAGDKLLVEVATTTLKEIRETDLIARYGGEEFLILLPEADITQAYEIAERIRNAVEAKTGVTISLGISPFHKDMHNKEALINKADEALYHAKQRGRNRTEVSG